MSEQSYTEFLNQIDRLDSLLHDGKPIEQGLTADSLDFAEQTVKLDEV